MLRVCASKTLIEGSFLGRFVAFTSTQVLSSDRGDQAPIEALSCQDQKSWIFSTATVLPLPR